MKMVLYTKCKDIPVYPEFTRILGKNNIPANAPICEDDDGLVAYVDSDSRKEWLNRFYAKEQRERNKNGKKGRRNKDD